MKYRDPNTNTFKDLTVKVSDTLPIGTIVGYAGTTAPDGWLICDGSAISRSLYSALFSAIGTSYGAGNGSTTFNIPDLRGRVGVGKSTDTEFNTLGKTGGEKTHTLTIEEIPSHTHMLDNTTTTGFAGGQSGAARDVGTPRKETSSTGGGQPHNILQPYIVENYIIKAYQPIAAPGKIIGISDTPTTNSVYNAADMKGALMSLSYAIDRMIPQYYYTNNLNTLTITPEYDCFCEVTYISSTWGYGGGDTTISITINNGATTVFNYPGIGRGGDSIARDLTAKALFKLSAGVTYTLTSSNSNTGGGISGIFYAKTFPSEKQN